MDKNINKRAKILAVIMCLAMVFSGCTAKTFDADNVKTSNSDKGEAIVDIMNEAKFDVAIPGNHEYDYGMDSFFNLVNHADYPYISCNFTKEGNLVLPPYKIIEKGGMKSYREKTCNSYMIIEAENDNKF